MTINFILLDKLQQIYIFYNWLFNYDFILFLKN